MDRRFAAVLAGVFVLGMGATLAHRDDPVVVAPDAGGRPSPLLRACPLLQAARLAASAPPAREAPVDGAAACSIAGQVREAFAKGDDALSDDELKALRTASERAMTDETASCSAAFAREIADAKDCGLVYDAVAIRLLTSKSADPAFSARELARPAPCQWKMISALREAERVDPIVAAAIVDLTASPVEDVRGASWLTLGTIERIARHAAENELAQCIDLLVSSELASRVGEDRETLISAAGNAGCAGCRERLHGILEAPDASDVRVRRSAVAALRFLTSERDVTTLCKVARTDRDASIRGAAAFALRHESVLLETRLKCLFEAATEDASDPVRHDAVASIAELAEREAERQLGVGTLVQVARRATDASTRAQAIEALRAFASEEAIKDALREP